MSVPFSPQWIPSFLTMARPFVIVIPENDYDDDPYFILSELTMGDDQYHGVADSESDALVFYCESQQAVDNLSDILRELNISFHHFI